jgi:response regulator RpfG family c-di-GMP phosphodiesterase
MSTTLPVVLIVDDEIRSLETLRRTLEEAFEVFTAASTDRGNTIQLFIPFPFASQPSVITYFPILPSSAK